MNTKEIIRKHNPNNRILPGSVNYYTSKGEKVYYEVKEFDMVSNKMILLGRNVTINEVK